MGQDQLVLEAVLPAHELRHGDAVPLRFEVETAQHVGDLAADFTRVQRMPPELRQRSACQLQGLALSQTRGHLGLTAGHEHHVARMLGQPERNGVVSGGVAGMQGRHHVDLLGQLRAVLGLLHGQRQKGHALESESARELLRPLHQLASSLDAVDRATRTLREIQVIDDEAQIGLACPVIGERDLLPSPCLQILQDLLDESVEVIDLLELAPRILVELAFAGQDVQLLEQLDRLPRPQGLPHLLLPCLGLASRRVASALLSAWADSPCVIHAFIPVYAHAPGSGTPTPPGSHWP